MDRDWVVVRGEMRAVGGHADGDRTGWHVGEMVDTVRTRAERGRDRAGGGGEGDAVARDRRTGSLVQQRHVERSPRRVLLVDGPVLAGGDGDDIGGGAGLPLVHPLGAVPG